MSDQLKPPQIRTKELKTRISMRCPVCRREFEKGTSPALPFCSERCRTIDLGRWLGENYSVPVEPDPDIEEPLTPTDSGDENGQHHDSV